MNKIPFIVVGLMALFAAYAIPRFQAEHDRRIDFGKRHGCDYIGQARDLNSVAFYDCNGVVRMERVR